MICHRIYFISHFTYFKHTGKEPKQKKFRWSKKRKIELCNCYELAVRTGDYNHNTLYKIWNERNKELNLDITPLKLSKLRKEFDIYNCSCESMKENDDTIDKEGETIGVDRFNKRVEDCAVNHDTTIGDSNNRCTMSIQGMYYC